MFNAIMILVKNQGEREWDNLSLGTIILERERQGHLSL